MKRLSLISLLCAVLYPLAVLPANAQAIPLTYEVRLPASEDPEAIFHVYICPACTPDNWESVVLPEGAKKSADRLRIMREPRFTPITPPPGAPATMDLSPTIPGPDMVYIGRVLSIEVVGFRFATGLQIRARVERTSTISFPAGSVVHELTDGDGDKWVMMSVPIERTIYDPAGEGDIDPAELDAFVHTLGPWGWTASSRVLEEELVISSHPVAEIVGGMWRAPAWQRVTNDEPQGTSIPFEQAFDR